MHALLLAVLLAAPTRLAKCDSGKTGKIELFVQKTDAGWALTSKDPTGARVFVGTVTSAKHQKLDRRHHVYAFQVEGGELTQAAGLDKDHCQPDGKVERC